MTQSEKARGSTTTEWDICALSDISEKIMVGIASAATHAYRSKGVPLLRNQNIGAGWLDDSDVLFVDPEYERVFRNKRLRAGDLLTARTGYPGLTCVVPDAYENAQSFTTLITRPDPQAVDSNYLAAYINSSRGQQFFNQSQIGGAQKNVNAATLRGMPIPLPQLNEQQAIAGALSDVDALLAGLDRLIAKKRDLKQAAMQQLLSGKVRLPGFREQWVKRSLGEMGRCLRGVTYQGNIDLFAHDTSNTKRLLRSNNVQEAAVQTTELQFVSSARVTPDQVLRRDDILICMANGSRALVGKAGLFQASDGYDYTFGAFMGCFRVHSLEANPKFLFFLFQTERYREYINNLSPSAIESLEFLTPAHHEQTAIGLVLSDMDAEIVALEIRREKTRALKQAMMQELLTGRIRLI